MFAFTQLLYFDGLAEGAMHGLGAGGELAAELVYSQLLLVLVENLV